MRRKSNLNDASTAVSAYSGGMKRGLLWLLLVQDPELLIL